MQQAINTLIICGKRLIGNETIKDIVMGGGIITFITYFAYRSWALSIFSLPLALLFPKYAAKKRAKLKQKELSYQFRDVLYAVSASLQAGRSVETAFKDALRDLAIQYHDPNAVIIKELKTINEKLEINMTIEAALLNWAERSCLDDIQNFVDVFHSCNRSGGNLIQVIKNSADILNEKLEVRQEIETMLTERRFEQKVLFAMPALILLLLSSSAADYVQPLFNTLVGRLVMTIAILMIAIAHLITIKIIDIEV